MRASGLAGISGGLRAFVQIGSGNCIHYRRRGQRVAPIIRLRDNPVLPSEPRDPQPTPRIERGAGRKRNAQDQFS